MAECLLALLCMATLLSLWLLAGSISVAGWSLSIIWAVCFPFIWPQSSYWSTSLSAVSSHVIRIFILGLTDQLNHNSIRVIQKISQNNIEIKSRKREA